MIHSLKVVHKELSAPHGTPTREPLQAEASNRVEGLYLHVPFCFHKCHYCDFYSITAGHRDPDAHAGWAERAAAELALRAQQCRLTPHTIFVGGGTPTLLHPEAWDRLGAALRAELPMNEVREFTVEANPETLTPEVLAALGRAGADRLSLGAQSFNPRHLATLERHHAPASVGRAVRLARAAGFERLSLDLIFAIPDQTLAEVDEDLEAALALAPEHLSIYGLTFEPGTALEMRRRAGRITPAPETRQRAMYERVIERLEAAGFEHYELSNWARRVQDEAGGPSPHRCEHNLLYWRNGNWLGIGPSAASHVGGHRWRNAPHLGRWLETRPEPPTIDHEALDPARRAGESLMLGLRLREGIPLTRLRQILGPEDPRWRAIEQYAAAGLLEWRNGHLRLTGSGLFVADGVMAELL